MLYQLLVYQQNNNTNQNGRPYPNQLFTVRFRNIENGIGAIRNIASGVYSNPTYKDQRNIVDDQTSIKAFGVFSV